MTQALVVSIKLGTVNSIPYFRDSTVIVIMLSHRYLSQLVKVEFEPSHGSSELFILQITCKQKVKFSCCLTLLTTAVSHEVKSSN